MLESSLMPNIPYAVSSTVQAKDTPSAPTTNDVLAIRRPERAQSAPARRRRLKTLMHMYALF
jgi:hypothetical protein